MSNPARTRILGYVCLILTGLVSLLAPRGAQAQEGNGANIAYAYANDPTAASYAPPGTFNPHGSVTVTRGGTGVYSVRFSGLGDVVQARSGLFGASSEAGAGGHVQVTARTPATYCKTSGWGAGGSDVTVGVRCFDAAGTPADAAFNVLFLEPGVDAGALSYAWADDPASPDYAPPGAYTFNGAGGDVRVTHTATGFYTVRFERMARFADASLPLGGGQYHVSAYGTDNLRCQVSGWNVDGDDTQAFVLCREPGGRLQDAPFSLLALWPGAELGTHAYAWADDPSAASSYTPAHAYNDAGAVSVNRQSTGRYTVTFAGLTGSPNAQVSVRQGADATCDTPGFVPFGDLAVRVNCYDETGALTDAEFAVTLFYGAAPTPGNTDVTVDFEDFSPSTLLDNELRSTLGITFQDMNVITCAAGDAVCSRSRSPRNVAAATFDGEFRRFPAGFYFGREAPQHEVIVSLNSALMDGQRRDVTMKAYETFDVVDEVTGTVWGDPSWTTRLRVASAENITRIEITARVPGAAEDDNQIVVDDLFFDNPAPRPPDEDPPGLWFEEPGTRVRIEDGYVVTDSPFSFIARVIDETLEEVVVAVQREADGLYVQPPTTVCGTVASGGCWSNILEPVSVALSAPGAYRLFLSATDGAGNSAEHTVTIDYAPTTPPTLPRAFVHKVEFNQSVTNRLYDRNVFAPQDVFIVPGKDLLVRYYLHSEDAPRPAFAAALDVVVEQADGTTFSRRLTPNAGNANVDLVPLPADVGTNRRDELVTMRADLTRTLNFVIPGEWFEDATFTEFVLWNGVDDLSRVQVHGIRDNRSILALQLVHVNEPRPGAGLARFDRDVRPYLEQALPFSEVQVLSERGFDYGGYVEPRFDGPCDQLLYSLTFYGDDFGPDGLPTGGRVWWSKLLLVENDDGYALDCGGIAYLNNVNAVSRYVGMIAGHEIGHNTGRSHAGNSHGEAGGGGFVPWPYAHGAIGPPGGTFGAILTPSTPPSGTSAGDWDVFLIDPCPTTDLARRFAPGGCDLMNDFMTGAAEHNTVPHELMSYGRNASLDASPLSTSTGRWPSYETYTYMHGRATPRPAAPGLLAASKAVHQTAAAGASSDDSVPVLVVSALVEADGTVGLLPAMGRTATLDELAAQTPGPYTIALLDADGTTLVQGTAAALESTDGTSNPSLVQLLLPYVSGVAAVRVSRDGAPVAEAAASPNAPEVRVLSPNGAEHYPDGTVPVRWEGRDADGDPLRYVIEYSPDGGAQWHTIGVVLPGQPSELLVEADRLRDGRRGRVRVTASDGLNTSTDESDGYFGVGPEPPVTSFDIWKADASSGAPTRVTYLDETDEFNPDWSPDGALIVHDVTTFDASGNIAGQSLYLTDVAAGTSTPLVGGEGGNDAAWHPEGDAILFDRCPLGSVAPVCEPSLYQVAAGGGVPVLVREDAVDGDWGPKAPLIVFHQPSDGSVRTRHLVSGREAVVAQSGVQPVFSPDGKYVAYVSGGDLYRIRVNGAGRPLGAPEQLTHAPATDSEPSWSPGGDRLAFHSDRTGDYDLYLLPPGGSPAHLTGMSGRDDLDPSWSPDGGTLAYAAFTSVVTEANPPRDTLPPPGQASAPAASALKVSGYPNPFNPTTTIRVELPETARVTLKVYDVLGREVAVLMDDVRADGVHTVTFDAGHLPSGTYFVRLQAGRDTLLRRLTLVK